MLAPFLEAKGGAFLPQSFRGSFDGEDWHTWESGLAGRHRIDFLAVPESWRGGVISRVDPSIDISGGALDHRLVRVDCCVKVPVHSKLQLRRPHVCDRTLLRHPTRAAILSRAAEWYKPGPWSEHPDDELVRANTWLRAAAAMVAARRKGGPAKPWISEAAMLAISVRSACRRSLDAKRKAHRRTLAAIVLASWADATISEGRVTRARQGSALARTAAEARWLLQRARNSGPSMWRGPWPSPGLWAPEGRPLRRCAHLVAPAWSKWLRRQAWLLRMGTRAGSLP